MENKYVRYNGGTISYYGCDEPKRLKIGKVYKVVFEDDRGWQTNLSLRGVHGEYNSVWFDHVPSPKKWWQKLFCHFVKKSEG